MKATLGLILRVPFYLLGYICLFLSWGIASVSAGVGWLGAFLIDMETHWKVHDEMCKEKYAEIKSEALLMEVEKRRK